jgi:hypothetical protein
MFSEDLPGPEGVVIILRVQIRYSGNFNSRGKPMTEAPKPSTPCADCTQSQAYDLPDGRRAMYCEHELAGAVWIPSVGIWCTYSPLTAAMFTNILTEPPQPLLRAH